MLLDGTYEERSLRDAAARGEAAWRRLGLRARSITPADLARLILSVAAIVLVTYLLLSAWRALLPLLVALVVAYVGLPVVDVLDRVLPRTVAALLVGFGEILLVVAFFVILVPPLLLEVPQLVNALPGEDEIRARIADAQRLVDALPPGIQSAINSGLEHGASELRTNLSSLAEVAIAYLTVSVLGLLGTFSFILGFIAVPSWLLRVLTAHQAGGRALHRALPTWLGPDFWAVARITDRTFGPYLRGQILRAFVFGCGLYLALIVLDHYNLAANRFPLTLAVFAAVAYLIPHIGAILGVLPAVVASLARSHEEALLVLGTYICLGLLEQHLLAPRVRKRSIDIPVIVLLPLLIAISRFGIAWVVIAAPLIVVARDVFRYVCGRLGTPPRPAGVLPDERWPEPAEVAVVAMSTTPRAQSLHPATGVDGPSDRGTPTT
jgi:predicted PurR-regulated permease PerM